MISFSSNGTTVPVAQGTLLPLSAGFCSLVVELAYCTDSMQGAGE
jgi:hypothetical protein